MTPAGQNYPIAEHSIVFWAVYLTGAITFTFALMLLFLVMVHRGSQATRTTAAPETTGAEIDAAPAAPALHPTTV